jgi:hypothetical protein
MGREKKTLDTVIIEVKGDVQGRHDVAVAPAAAGLCASYTVGHAPLAALESLTFTRPLRAPAPLPRAAAVVR